MTVHTQIDRLLIELNLNCYNKLSNKKSYVKRYEWLIRCKKGITDKNCVHKWPNLCLDLFYLENSSVFGDFGHACMETNPVNSVTKLLTLST